MRPASDEDLPAVWNAARTARIFPDSAAFETFRGEAPWRVRVNSRGEAAVVERWRDHLDLLAIRGLWCSPRRVAVAVEDLRAVARAQGLGRLLGPLLCEDAARPYLAAGMRVAQRTITLRLDRPGRHKPGLSMPEGVGLRLGTAADLPDLLDLDTSCFDLFWRYDAVHLMRYVAEERLALAESASGLIGYTLCTVTADEGMVNRLAVRPDARNRGVGRALLSDAIAYSARAGAVSVMLCTQTDNAASRRLYAAAGFREMAGRMVFPIDEGPGPG